jgi:cytidine deaminase
MKIVKSILLSVLVLSLNFVPVFSLNDVMDYLRGHSKVDVDLNKMYRNLLNNHEAILWDKLCEIERQLSLIDKDTYQIRKYVNKCQEQDDKKNEQGDASKTRMTIDDAILMLSKYDTKNKENKTEIKQDENQNIDGNKEIKESDLDFDFKNLMDQASKARENSYSPYSKFKVGAALLTKSGKIYTGTNVENASYGLTVCAERIAIFNAVSQGEKGNFIKAIAIVLDAPEYGAPCGACRQVINEFAESDAYVVMGTVSGKYKIEQLKTLLPYAFKLELDEK